MTTLILALRRKLESCSPELPVAARNLFFDASVFIAAAGSPTDGSAAVLELGRRGLVRMFGSKLVLLKAERKIQEKMPSDALLRFYDQIGTARLRLAKPASTRELEEAHKIVAEKDAHVLAAAIKRHVDARLTLDRKHLLTSDIRAASPELNQTPGEFLQ